MQLAGFALLMIVLSVGFISRDMSQVKTFDLHALFIILGGCLSTLMMGSKTKSVGMTFIYLREFIPGLKKFSKDNLVLETQMNELCESWGQDKRSAALDIASRSSFEIVKKGAQMLVERSGGSTVDHAFTQLRHEETLKLQPVISNWEMLSKLGPSFGMVGTISGMIQLFKSMGEDNTNMGAAMSLALLATFYGVAFGAGVAGPIAHYLGLLLDDRLAVLERCEKALLSAMKTRGQNAT